jgi:hypothetical protein
VPHIAEASFAHAFTVTVKGLWSSAGAVNRPLAEIWPAEAVQPQALFVLSSE